MERKDAVNVKSGLSEEVLAELNAHYAVLDSALKVINQLRHNSEKKTQLDGDCGPWVYDMEGLQNWVHHYTERKRLKCPCCKEESSDNGVRFICTECLTEYQYHDEL